MVTGLTRLLSRLALPIKSSAMAQLYARGLRGSPPAAIHTVDLSGYGGNNESLAYIQRAAFPAQALLMLVCYSTVKNACQSNEPSKLAPCPWRLKKKVKPM